ncbi:unnamed protein product, partial [Rotaria magnacalcarata]
SLKYGESPQVDQSSSFDLLVKHNSMQQRISNIILPITFIN